VALAYGDFAPLALGHLTTEGMLQGNLLRANTPLAKQLALALFPQELWFRPPMDDLLA
jgi:hypothetical protein